MQTYTFQENVVSTKGGALGDGGGRIEGFREGFLGEVLPKLSLEGLNNNKQMR